MGRHYLPPHVIVAVGLLAALGAVLTALARPAERDESPERAAVPAVAPLDPPAVLASAQVEPETAEPAPAAPRVDPGTRVLRPARGGTVVLRTRPRGPVLARLGPRTEFGSPTRLAVRAERGRWLGVLAPQAGNGRLGWIDPEENGVRSARVRVSLVVDLSARRLVVRRGDRVLRRVRVGIGRASSPTPQGRFAVTDKIPGTRYGSYYGCCILALTARQPRLPAGWRGGDRIAVHGTDDPSSVGAAVSAGCPRARDADLRYLMRVVPLGSPVLVRA